MKITQLGNTDIIGTRFNGQDLHKIFRKKNMQSYHIVWDKKGHDPHTEELIKSYTIKRIIDFIRKIETYFSLQSLFSPAPLFLFLKKSFMGAKLIHYHILHTGYFSLLFLPLLTRIKKGVLTLHDPWALTGHCIYPRDCERWQIGCGTCPYLSVQFSMKKDKSALMWKIKKFIFNASKLDIIVASNYMKNLVENSSFFAKSKIHTVPFGIDLNFFKPPSAELKEKIRDKLGIKPGHVVICLRSTPSPFKGIEFIYEAINRLKIKNPITILTFEVKGLFNTYLGKHQIIDLGWVDDENLTLEAYQVSDIFLMPSKAEAFGMMAIEAMACGKPVVVLEGTSLPEVTYVPQGGGIACPLDIFKLADILSELIDHPEKRSQIGEKARELALKYYSLDTHVERVLSVYQDVLNRA